jgi:two-component system, OmpR family, response regulator
MRVLVVEDAAKLRRILQSRLRNEGYAVDGAATGIEAVSSALADPYDAVVLDLRLPDLDGVEVCARLRRAGCWSPILMLTARDGVDDRVRGLDVGADDYLTKPFAFPELFARVRALVRRGVAERPSRLVSGDLIVDPGARTVARAGHRVELTAREFGLLEYLMRHPGIALGRDRLTGHVWDGRYQGDSNIVDVNIRGIREKIDRPFGCRSIETVRGVGYRFVG